MSTMAVCQFTLSSASIRMPGKPSTSSTTLSIPTIAANKCASVIETNPFKFVLFVCLFFIKKKTNHSFGFIRNFYRKGKGKVFGQCREFRPSRRYVNNSVVNIKRQSSPLITFSVFHRRLGARNSAIPGELKNSSNNQSVTV